jgi:3-isopropylmalate/(R)-2-methylmalate dehydratase small subunit
VVVGGRNFGTGSSRPAAGLFVDLGVRAIIAESLNGLFMRNCINAGLAAMACPGVVEVVAEGDVVSYEPGAGTIINIRTGDSASGAALPAELLAIIADGGLFERLRRAGLLRPRDRTTQVGVKR